MQIRTVAGTTTFVYGVGGQLLAEYGVETGPQTRYLKVYALGSTPVRTAANGFSGQEEGIRLQFTGKERDAETGLDFFL